MVLGQTVVSADLLLVLGSIDTRVAEYAAELSREYDYARVAFSGGIAHHGDLLETAWGRSEAEHFHAMFLRSGGVAESVILETAAENTGQNAVLTYELIKQSGFSSPRTIEIVTKPYMERRAKATFDAQWPDGQTQLFVTSPHISFDDYVDAGQPFELVVTIMVGDLERIIEYPKKGFQTRQNIPTDVREAWRRLVKAGYTGHIMHE